MYYLKAWAGPYLLRNTARFQTVSTCRLVLSNVNNNGVSGTGYTVSYDGCKAVAAIYGFIQLHSNAGTAGVNGF